LARNNFNAVRLPLMAASILENKVPNGALMNKQENRGIDITSYMALLKSIVKVLQYRNIGVLLSMHTLTYSDNGKLWYNADVPEAKFLQSIDALTKNLCSNEYWNVMGIDLKNEPSEATWGDGAATDFNAGAKRIANRMLKGCPSWMGFVEGVNSKHTMSIGSLTFSYYDWYGGGLQGAKKVGLDFAVKNKVVWAPHYYTPAVYPQEYFFGGGTLGAGLQGYVELSDKELRGRVKATMDDMFGFLASETGPALLLGEFGGLYAEDKHPKKTTQRCTDFTIEVIKQPGWAGGFVWSLNPESEYQYNPADTPGRFFEGLVGLDWLTSNKPYVKGMAAMDDMENLQPFPCFPTKAAKSTTAPPKGASS
jgi:endoglucanase